MTAVHHTDRLVLRCLRPEDAPWIAREIAIPEVQMWLTTPPCPYTIDDAHAFVALHENETSHLVICADGEGQGVVSLSARDGNLPELGYWLRRGAWGQGYMTEASRAVLETHFENAGGPVQSGWLTGNRASENVLRKLGFVDTAPKTRFSQYHGQDVEVARVRLDPPGAPLA